MSKVNFLEIYNHDSSTEELCISLANQYKKAAKNALEKSGLILAAMKETNPEIDIPWHYRTLNKAHNK